MGRRNAMVGLSAGMLAAGCASTEGQVTELQVEEVSRPVDGPLQAFHVDAKTHYENCPYIVARATEDMAKVSKLPREGDCEEADNIFGAGTRSAVLYCIRTGYVDSEAQKGFQNMQEQALVDLGQRCVDK